MAMSARFATFDCYGTLIDWNGGIGGQLARLWPDADRDALLERYHEIEPRVQLDGSLPYRQVLAEALRLLAESEGLELPPGEEGALGDSLPDWPAFPEVPGELAALRGLDWRLAVLTNSDPDLIAASLERIGVPFDDVITADQAGSYKPAHGHWERFRERHAPGPGGHVHVAASAFHDLGPAAELGIPAVWINRLGEESEHPRAAELSSLTGLARTLERLCPA
jgi:2-haloacid dehalogenase